MSKQKKVEQEYTYDDADSKADTTAICFIILIAVGTMIYFVA